MEKYNLLKVLEIIYNDTKNTAILSQIENYSATLRGMTEDDYKKVKGFYLEFIVKYFQNKLNKINQSCYLSHQTLKFSLLLQMQMVRKLLSLISFEQQREVCSKRKWKDKSSR